MSETFDDAPIAAFDPDEDPFLVDVDGYAGPLDLLLDMARRQKVDLRRISMAALVDQYLRFVEAAKARRLELAADYLVMAAWLTFLKSKLLLPAPETDGEEPTGEEMAAHLAFQLQRLEAMRKAADDLMALPQRGRETHPCSAGGGLKVVRRPEWRADIYDLLKAYSRQRLNAIERGYRPEPPRVLSIEDAREDLRRALQRADEWVTLDALGVGARRDAPPQSVAASAFGAALEFAKDGAMDLRQEAHFDAIYVRRRDAEPGA